MYPTVIDRFLIRWSICWILPAVWTIHPGRPLKLSELGWVLPPLSNSWIRESCYCLGCGIPCKQRFWLRPELREAFLGDIGVYHMQQYRDVWSFCQNCWNPHCQGEELHTAESCSRPCRARDSQQGMVEAIGHVQEESALIWRWWRAD